MIAKINRGSSIYGAVIYNHDKVREGSAVVISGNRMITDMSENPENIIQQTLFSFEPYLQANNRTKKPILHISLNPSTDDKLSNEQFALLAKDYMEKMNYGDQPYIVYLHEDTGRRHIHIVSVCVNETGQKIDDSYEHRRSMVACRELEIKHGLKQINDEKRESENLFLKKVDYQKGDVKHQVSNILKYVSDYKFRTFGEYSALLSVYNVEAKTVKGEGIDGKPFNGIVYSATDDTDKAVSNPFKSSLFSKSYGYEGLNKKMAKNDKSFKDGKYTPLIRSDIAKAMKTCKSKDDFIQKLKEKGIDAVFRINESGRLYGATFVDHNRKEVYNGSVLGKEFSANVFHKLFNEIMPESNSKPETGENNIKKPSREELFSFSSNDRETMIEQALGLFDLQLSPDESDYEEDALRRQMKRKKKSKKRGFSL